MTFTVALFAILETGNSPKQPSMSGCGWAKKKPQYIHTMENYSAIKGTNYSYKK